MFPGRVPITLCFLTGLLFTSLSLPTNPAHCCYSYLSQTLFYVILGHFLNIIQGDDYQMWNCLARCLLLRKYSMNAGFLLKFIVLQRVSTDQRAKCPTMLCWPGFHWPHCIQAIQQSSGIPPHLPISDLPFHGYRNPAWPFRDHLKCHLCHEAFQEHPPLYHHGTYWCYFFLVNNVSHLEIIYW